MLDQSFGKHPLDRNLPKNTVFIVSFQMWVQNDEHSGEPITNETPENGEKIMNTFISGVVAQIILFTGIIFFI